MSIETMTKITSTTLSATSASVTFSNIPQTYTDLLMVCSTRDARTNVAVTDIQFNINGTGLGTTWSGYILYSNGTTTITDAAGVSGGSVAWGATATSTANVFSNTEIYISNYSSSNFKPILSNSAIENNAASGWNAQQTTLWSNASPITSITMTPFSSPFAANSSFTLYGIRNMARATGNSFKATGGTITYDGTYVYHAFTSSGTLVTNSTFLADYLVVAGGGGAGGIQQGGAGAGGFRTSVGTSGGNSAAESQILLVSGNTYPITVGAGGTGALHSGTPTPGSNSVFATITSLGGGISSTSASTGSGGSGGGGNTENPTVRGLGTAGQGMNGGFGSTNNPGTGAGGGGASQAGENGKNGENNTAGYGGAGLASLITGRSVTYAGGGGGGGNAQFQSNVGGPGGVGGGGNGAGYGGVTNATAGTANTGGGGGAGGYQGTYLSGANGGSGIVIVRYKA